MICDVTLSGSLKNFVEKVSQGYFYDIVNKGNLTKISKMTKGNDI